MPEFIINGIPVNFPFKPYDVQTAYMEKVIDCLQNSANGVLESPTGTGKTLSLLCSSLGWVQLKKAQVQANMQNQLEQMDELCRAQNISAKSLPNRKNLANYLVDTLNQAAGPGLSGKMGTSHGVPKVIYASRTHSQISQAIGELKRTSYNYMKAAVIGSRDQLCIHPDLAKETNANKIQMCKLKVSTRTCSFHNRLDSAKESPEFTNGSVMDIEDIVTIGRKLKCCPYYASKELMDNADIVFMPYNYLLDPKIRKANKVDLNNTIIILDEAHNVEKMCEESASVQITSSEIAIAITDVNYILQPMVDNGGMMSQSFNVDTADGEKDFTMDDLVLLKEMLLSLEKAIDEIPVKCATPGMGETFEGGYMFSLLEKANINQANHNIVIGLLDTLNQFLASDAESKNSVFRHGVGLQKLHELLVIVFSSTSEDFRSRVAKCYKVYIEYEQAKPTRGKKNDDGWIQAKAVNTPKTTAKVINYWCFSPGFGMQYLLGKNVRSIILTSGTLAPLKPLISELDIPISVNLENPHIVDSSQVCVKIISHGSDKEMLNSNYENRSNPKYIDSLGRTILSFCPVIPGGLLVFFPSYYILNTCKDKWQASGIWAQIQRTKPIYIEPQSKEMFNEAMNGYYGHISAPGSKGAIFMAVCRGKVSEGLDFADQNGRAVIITGLPFPPFKDPKIVLKKKYLSDNRTRQNEMLSGDDWYFLEASRAVNQAIGRVIRHKNDYGAILLCDCRFNNQRQKNQLSSWLQGHLKNQVANQTFGSVIGEISRFFRNAERTLPQPTLKPLKYEDDDGVVNNTETFSSKTDSGFSFSSRSTSSSSVTVKKEPEASITKANDVFSWDMYKKPAEFVEPMKKKMNLFDGLDSEVSSINFNNVDTSSSQSGVKIHKRPRISFENASATSASSTSASSQSQLDMHDANGPKKRKFKIVPNDAFSLFTGSSSQESTSISQSKANTALTSVVMVVPEDRSELLKLVRTLINADKYKLFIQMFGSYQKNSHYESFLSTLYNIFDDPRLNHILRGMKRFVKPIHKDRFDRDIDNHINNKVIPLD